MTCCCHSVLTTINKKRKNAPLSAALLSFCLVCKISFCTSFQTFLRRDFVIALYLFSFFFFCHQAICIHCLLHDHPRPYIFIWKKPGHIWCADIGDLCEQKFPTQHPAVCSLLLPLLLESGYECLGFCFHKWSSFLFQSFRHKTVV